MKKAFRIIHILLLVVLVVFAATAISLPRLIATGMYEQNFGIRNGSNASADVNLSIYSGLKREKCTFTSDEGQELTGYRYYHEGDEPRAVVVVVQGYGSGHTVYLPVINHLAQSGYLVFSYDLTGCGESGGDSIVGLPQSVVDLDYALRYVKACDDFADLPILLWGHSQGAYAVGSVLALHPDVKAAILCSGFNHSLDMLEVEGRKMLGNGIDFLLPAIDKLEEDKFGKYADMNCLDGLAATGAGVMILHSADDATIDKATSYDVFEAAFGGNERFTFKAYEDRGHYCYYHTVDASSLNTPFGSPMGGFPGGFSSVVEITTLDEALMDEMVVFYEQYLTE